MSKQSRLAFHQLKWRSSV